MGIQQADAQRRASAQSDSDQKHVSSALQLSRYLVVNPRAQQTAV
jgi:hypothetical protein